MLLQRNQQGFNARAANRQGFGQNVNENNRDPREQAFRQAQGQQNQGQGNNEQFPGADQGQQDAQLLFGGGGGGYYGGSGAVTIEQGRGLAAAEVIRSAGEFNRNTAAAEVLHEQAREQAIDNRYSAVKTYFDVRQLNRQERNDARGRMPTQEDLLRYSQDRLPERLPLASLDRDTGAIRWPAVLKAPEFDEHRARLEQVFQGRSYYNSGLASQSYLEIKEEAGRMLLTLQDRVREIEPVAYVHAKNFITSLGYEGRFLAGNERVALGK
jgi:hypothetical protein